MVTTLIIDAYKEHDVTTFDVLGAYLHAFLLNNKNIIMVLRNKFVDIMCDVKEYKQHVTHLKNGKRILYIIFLRIIYGCIDLALCWYNIYFTTLKHEDFTINPYDIYVANKIIKGKQYAITWYVDNNKISHVKSKIIDGILDTIEEHFRKLVIMRGKTHKLLGIKIYFTNDNKIEISMKD